MKNFRIYNPQFNVQNILKNYQRSMILKLKKLKGTLHLRRSIQSKMFDPSGANAFIVQVMGSKFNENLWVIRIDFLLAPVLGERKKL